MPTRRELVVGGLAGVAGIGIGALASNAERLVGRVLPSAPKEQDLSPYGIYNGAIAIHRGVNLRTSPRIPDRTRFKSPSNTTRWETIAFVNKTPLPAFPPPAFVVSNPELVGGQPTEDYARNFPSSPWIKLLIQQYNGEALFAYASLNGGKPYVEILNSGITLSVGDGNYISYKDRGEIFIPNSADRVARDTVPQIWAKEVAGKLDGTIPLRSRRVIKYNVNDREETHEDRGERIVQVAQVVAAGDNLRERTEMEMAQIPVNVRNHPGRFYYNDEPVEILGVVKQGTEIENVLVDQYSWWSATARESIKGEIYDQNGNSLNISPNQIVAIWDHYLKY